MSQRNRALTDNESDGSERSWRTPRARRRKDPREETFNTATPSRQVSGSVMSQDRIPLIGSPGSRTAAVRPVLSTLQRTPQARRRKRPSAALPDSMAPWEGRSFSESSFTSIPPPPPLPAPASNPASDPHTALQPITALPQPARGRSVRRRPSPPRRPPRPPRLPPLRPITNLSFSRSFTFSFFELPLYQSARSRAERLRDLTLLLRQIQY